MRGTARRGSPQGPSETLTADEARELIAQVRWLIDTCDPSTLAGLRNRAIFGVIGYAGASVDTIIRMRVGDYYSVGEQHWLRLMENGDERHSQMPPALEPYIDEYLAAAGIENELTSPLFRATLSGSGRITTSSKASNPTPSRKSVTVRLSELCCMFRLFRQTLYRCGSATTTRGTAGNG